MSTKKKFLMIGGFVLVIILFYMVVSNMKTGDSSLLGKSPFSKDKTHCGLVVLSPKDGAKVKSEIAVSAVVDNVDRVKRGCSWGVFEAQAGTIIARDKNNEVVGTGVLTTKSEWMTEQPVSYESVISVQAGFTGPITLSFVEDNSADIPKPDTHSIGLVVE